MTVLLGIFCFIIFENYERKGKRNNEQVEKVG